MKGQRLFITFAAMIAVLASVSVAGAFDTSPYLAGIWEGIGSSGHVNLYNVVNPTTKPLDVYTIWYNQDGSFKGCLAYHIAANGVQDYGTGLGGDDRLKAGAIKFFAFPQGSSKFDPNAVIGGFQRKGESNPYVFYTEANLKAVTINSYTIGEFTQIPWGSCPFSN